MHKGGGNSDSKQNFSIIIPNHKTKLSYVRAAIESVKNQNYPLDKLEVILIDTHSPRKYQEELSRMVLHNFNSKLDINLTLTNTNLTVGANRNQAVKNSRHDYLIFLDADDMISPDLCDLVNKRLKWNKYNLIYTDQRLISANGERVLGIKRKSFLHEHMHKHFGTLQDPRFHCNFIHHVQIVSKEAFYKVGCYDEKLTTAEDVDLLIKITNLGLDKICYIPRILHNYRVTHNGLTRKNKYKHLRDFSRILKKHVELKGFKIGKVKYWKGSGFTWFDIYDSTNNKIEVPYMDELIKNEYSRNVDLKNIKLIAIDVDNTLIKPGGKIQKNIIEIFKKIKCKGIKICLCSGRGYDSLERISKITKTDDYFIGEIGATTKFGDEHVLLKEEEAFEIRKALRGLATVRGRKIAVMVKERDYEKVEKTLKENKLEVSFQKNNLSKADIVPSGIDKGVGLKHLRKRLGIKKNQVLAFGDFLNDLPMFREAGVRVAVANAHPKVKEEADLITNRGYGMGVYEILSNILEIKSL
ncbi:MAG: phosphoglycolate phosphatase [Candidatus Altiarchaeales archaeon]|nr:phosphoglycolate phosphatase [Candidatus Altiarchaeales archaeon]MBD3416896.1 phosphoglycolate phosphatase [Candidatus Altiarchaeales archaeon]